MSYFLKLCQPSQLFPPKDIEEGFDNVMRLRIDIAKNHDIKLLFAFDGTAHKVKSVVRIKRNNAETKIFSKI